MNEDRPSSERHGERDSQLSAMFDGELSAAECELLARRLARDEVLRGQWTRYALIGAALRAERGVALHDRVAWRVQSAVAQEASYGDSSGDAANSAIRPATVVPATSSSAPGRWIRFARPVAGAGIAAGVAAISILWLRAQPGDPQLLARAEAPAPSTQIVLTPEPGPVPILAATPKASRDTASEAAVFSATPEPSSRPSFAPPARLANYVVAHSEYSGPLSRRLALSGLVAGEPAEGITMPESAAPAQNSKPDTKKVATDAP